MASSSVLLHKKQKKKEIVMLTRIKIMNQLRFV